MNAQRRDATAEILYFINRFVDDDGRNRQLYKNRLDAMTDDEFEHFIVGLEGEDEILALFVPNNDQGTSLDIERNYAIADELQYPLFQHLYLTDPDTGQVSKTPVKHLVVDLPQRRQAQMLYKKMSIPENNHVVDERSGQATGPSKGARMSYPELQITAGKGLDKSILELIKFRGGDVRAYTAMTRQIHESGEASTDSIREFQPSKVKATTTLATYLKAMHLSNNLDE